MDRSDQGNKWIYGSVLEYTAFLFMGQTLWKESVEDKVKLLESNVLNCCLKIMADLRKIGH